MNKNEIKNAIKGVSEGTYKKLMNPFYAGGAAETAFWLLLSLVPATIVLAQILQVFTLSMEAAQNILGAYVSGDFYNLIAPLFEYKARGSVTVLLIAIALMAGSNTVFTLMRIINQAYGVAPKTDNTIVRTIRDRARAILMTLLVLVTIIFALYILVYGEIFVKTALSYTNDLMGYHYTFSEVWYGMRWVIAFILFFLMAFTVYYFLPRSDVSYKEYFLKSKFATARKIFRVWLKSQRKEFLDALPGSLFTAVAMLVVTRIYTIFVQYVARENINILYGGLSSVVVLLLWFYAMAYVMIVGIQVNAANREYLSSREQAPAGQTDD